MPPSTRRKQSIKRKPSAAGLSANLDAAIVEEEGEDGGAASGAALGIRCVAGEFRAAIDTLFETLDETNAWFVFCVNPNDSQLPNQLEGRGVKAQVRSTGLPELSRRAAVVFEVSMTPLEFCDRYRDQLRMLGVDADAEPAERVISTRDALGLGERDMVLGTFKVGVIGFLHISTASDFGFLSLSF